MKWFFSLALLVFSCAHGSRLHAQASAPYATGRVMIEQGDVTSDSVAAVESELAKLDADANVTEIYLRINSHGGEVEAGLGLIQFYETLHKPLTCIVDTKGWSMGMTLLEGCPVRWMTARSTLMMHGAMAQTQGNERDMKDAAETGRVITESLIQIAALRMSISENEIREHINGRQWWLDAKDAQAVGAIDAIVSPRDLPPITPLAKPISSTLEELLRGS